MDSAAPGGCHRPLLRSCRLVGGITTEFFLAERILGGDIPVPSIAREWRTLRSFTSRPVMVETGSLCLALNTRYRARLTGIPFRFKYHPRTSPAIDSWPL